MAETSLDYKLGVIDTKLDQIINGETARDRRVGAVERRVGVLENAKWKLIGMAAGASAVGGFVWAIIAH